MRVVNYCCLCGAAGHLAKDCKWLRCAPTEDGRHAED
jgi:hypothetical protein